MSDDRALEAAADAIELVVHRDCQGGAVLHPDEYAEAGVAAYLDCLLGDLPEEAMQAAMGQASWRKAIRAFLCSVRGSLNPGGDG